MRTEAQTKADKKYRKSGKYKFRSFGTRMRIDNIEKISKGSLWPTA